MFGSSVSYLNNINNNNSNNDNVVHLLSTAIAVYRLGSADYTHT